MRFVPFAVATLVALSTLALEGSARAEPTTWFAVGGGYGFQRNGYDSTDARAGALSFSIGVGTTAKNPIVVGGIWRTVTHFSLGTDVGLGLRFATRGFARGDWGLALDAGVAGRWWKHQSYGHFPIQAILTGGLPWGFNVAVGADLWDVSGDTPRAQGGFALIEIDFLRLTVMRGGDTTRFWPNPAPADGASH